MFASGGARRGETPPRSSHVGCALPSFHTTVKPVDVAAEPRCVGPPAGSPRAEQPELVVEIPGGLRCPPLARPGDASAAGVDPRRFHEDLSELAREIAQMAKAVAPGRRSSRIGVHLSVERSGRVINDSQVINGKRVQVQRRRPFAVFVG